MATRLSVLGGMVLLMVGGGCTLVLGVDKDYHAPGGGGSGGTGASGTTSAGTGGAGEASSATSTGTGGAGDASSAASTGAGGTGCLPGDGTAFALTKLDFGAGNSGEWKKVGFNIDGLVSTSASVDVCKPSSGGTATVAYPDGDGGIDNSFGKNFLPTLLALDPTWVSDVDASLQSGSFNMLMKMYCLPPTGDAPLLLTRLFDGTALGMTPKLDGTDVWPVAPELLANPVDPESSKISFTKSSVTGAMFDSGKGETIILRIPMTAQSMSTSIVLTLHAAHATMTLSADRKSATSGRIGGVLDTEEFVAEIKKVGALLGVCGSPLFTSLISQVRQASDILADGGQDPTKTCDGISIGLGFEMSEVKIGGVGPMAPADAACP
jgi:hypothetical protein